MPESVHMTPGDTVSKSPLDKPLHLLTEEDISQLTREDCRRYLKEKGMRRPSWNKSQAIQQVISLKTLLETSSDAADASTRKRLYIPRPENQQQRVHRGTSADTEVSASAEDSFPNLRKDADKPDISGDLSGRLVSTDNGSLPNRTTGVMDGLVGQMTIFYCGKVNVYDDIPSDKAQVIMQLAASPLHSPGEALSDVVRSTPFRTQASGVRAGPDSSLTPLPALQSEVPLSRKASVQRYLEKKKDRLKSKKKIGMHTSSGWDPYLNHHLVNPNPNEYSSRSGPCSPTPIRPPDTPNRCSSAENNNNNILRTSNLSAAPSEKGLQN